MVLMYPQPTIVNKLVLVAMTERGRKAGRAAGREQGAAGHRAGAGLPRGRPTAFADTAKRAGLAVDTS